MRRKLFRFFYFFLLFSLVGFRWCSLNFCNICVRVCMWLYANCNVWLLGKLWTPCARGGGGGHLWKCVIFSISFAFLNRKFEFQSFVPKTFVVNIELMQADTLTQIHIYIRSKHKYIWNERNCEFRMPRQFGIWHSGLCRTQRIGKKERPFISLAGHQCG